MNSDVSDKVIDRVVAAINRYVDEKAAEERAAKGGGERSHS